MKHVSSLLASLLAIALIAPVQAADKPADKAAPTASAAKPAANTNMQILLDKVKADKKLLVASNIALTEEEGKAFWPIYESYQKDLGALNDRLGKAIMSYAEAYNAGTLTDEAAAKLANEAIAIEEGEAQMRKGYAGKLTKAVPAKKAALYLQIEAKIRAAVRYEMAKQIPLVQ